MRAVDTDSYYDDQLECWIRKEGDNYLIGITDWSQGYIGDLSLLHLEVDAGSSLAKGELFAIIESDKTSIELHMPVDGVVISTNEQVVKQPSLINKDCYARSQDINKLGWIISIQVANEEDLSLLLSPHQYQNMVDSFFKKGD